MINWTLKTIPLKDLRDHPKNPRQITKEQYRHLEGLIDKFGLIDKPVINSDNTIIGGHQRVKILKKKKVKAVECWVPDNALTDAEVEELLVRHNLNQGSFDYELLANNFDAIDLLHYGFTEEQLLGNIQKEIDELEGKEEDEAPEPAKDEDAITKPGDLYELGEHRLLCGSATDILSFEKIANDFRVDLVITDPPYNVDYVGKTKDALKIKNDSMSDGNFYQFLYDAYINIYSICKEGASIYVFHADMEGVNFRKAFKEAGFKLSECLIWVKNSLVMGRQDYHWKHEPIIYGWKEGEAHKWYSDRTQTTVLEFDRPSRSEEHPTMKPITIIEYLMKNSSKKNDYVLDPFLGSGTTLIAAERLQRKCVGVELSPAYCDVIVKRYINFVVKKGEIPNIKRNGEIISHEGFI